MTLAPYRTEGDKSPIISGERNKTVIGKGKIKSIHGPSLIVGLISGVVASIIAYIIIQQL